MSNATNTSKETSSSSHQKELLAEVFTVSLSRDGKRTAKQNLAPHFPCIGQATISWHGAKFLSPAAR